MSSSQLKYKCRNCKEKFTEPFGIRHDACLVVTDVVTNINEGRAPGQAIVAEHHCASGEVGIADLIGAVGT